MIFPSLAPWSYSIGEMQGHDLYDYLKVPVRCFFVCVCVLYIEFAIAGHPIVNLAREGKSKNSLQNLQKLP